MELENARHLFEALKKERSSYGYSGSFHDEHSVRLITLGEASSPEEEKSLARGKLAFVMVEAFQNIIRHRAALPAGIDQAQGRCFFSLHVQEKGAQVLAINPMLKSDVPGLQETMHRLSGRDRSELKEMFMSGLQRAGDGRRRGAGLGLIEMARRSGRDLAYTLRGLGEEHDLLVLAVRLGLDVPYGTVVATGAALHGLIIMNDIGMFYVGPRNTAVDEMLLRTVEQDLDARADRQSIRGKVCLAMMESVHTDDPGSRSMFIASRAGGHDDLIGGAVMERTAADRLMERVGQLAGLDAYAIQRHYRDALLNREGGSLPAGLLELVRSSVEPIHARAWPADGGVLVLLRAVY